MHSVILLKDAINIDKQCEALLCSYFLKTIIFWVSEELLPSVWTPENLIPCFMRCFRRLIFCVEYSVCPHYFIPENNLFENKIEGKERELLLSNLENLHSNDWKCIFRSPQITLFEPSPNLDIPLIPFICNFQKLANSDFLLKLKENFFLMGNTKKGYVQAVHNLLYLQSTRIQYIHLYLMSSLSENMPEAMPQIKRDGNKYYYKQYNTYLSYLLQNTHQDCVSEWLILASLFYKTQQYNKVLYLTLYSLSKCTSEKLCQGEDLTDTQIELLSLKTIQKKGKINLLKLLKVQCCAFGRTFLIPTELQMNVPIDEIKFFPILPPVVLAHFLRVLCHYHLNNIKQCRKSVSALGLTIAEDYFIPKCRKAEKADSFDCLGVALQLIGETENAKQAFVRSIELKPEQPFNLSYKRLYEIVKGLGRVLVLKKPNFQYTFDD
ncbi:uncharacterized protein LOC134696663 isoform X1 [Mytilus trossulus]|uniref:uncharacterized protein LOC134696663 isoform X1 n=1 Tax=Mytilus trossulus TaxID=6551 RepID=UPI00300706ED